jgi:hypothetical protein
VVQIEKVKDLSEPLRSPVSSVIGYGLEDWCSILGSVKKFSVHLRRAGFPCGPLFSGCRWQFPRGKWWRNVSWPFPASRLRLYGVPHSLPGVAFNYISVYRAVVDYFKILTLYSSEQRRILAGRYFLEQYTATSSLHSWRQGKLYNALIQKTTLRVICIMNLWVLLRDGEFIDCLSSSP